MTNSDIFNSYANLMKEKGLLIEASEDPRVGSDDLSTIEMLYGVKPNGKDEKDMIDQAHPESCIMAPAYDRINGLIENEKERQKVMNYIVLKPQQATFKFRYVNAAEDLKNELVRVGFLMDGNNQEDLAKLADSCLDKMVKEAVLPAIVLYPLIAAGVTALYAAISQNVTFPQGVAQDAEKALMALQEVLKDYPQLSTELSNVINLIAHVYVSAMKATHLSIGTIQQAGPVNKSTPPQNAAKASAKFMENNLDEEAISILNDYKNECLQLISVLPKYVSLLQLRAKQLEPTHTNFSDLARRLYRFVIPSDMEDAWKALQRLTESLVKEPALIDQQISLMEQMRDKYDDVLSSPKATPGKVVTLPTVDLSKKPNDLLSKPNSDVDTLKQLING